jgi:hypothetical protein
MVRRSWVPALVIALLGCGVALPLRAAVHISEVMYNPLQGADLEYIEIHNDGAAVDIGGWSFAGITFTFPSGTMMPAGAHFVVCRVRTAFEEAYPAVPAASVFGSFGGALDNAGETITLRDALLATRDSVTYGTDPPWEFLADGFGASLERICFTASAALPENWRAGAVPASMEEFGGSPGAPNGTSLCPPAAPGRPRVFITEVMYHPVLEQAFEDEHEFIEIANDTGAAISIAGWRLAGAIDYTFPPGATLADGAFAVIARNRTALAAVASYGLVAGSIFGDYARTLDNGGEKVALIGADGQGIDSVTYDDDFPWPIGADALGADEEWLRPALLPLTNHRYRGISLERVSIDVSSGEIANWAPSPIDGATPGRANASTRPSPLPIVADLLVQPSSGGGSLIRSSNQVLIQARFSPESPSGAVDLQYFIDNVSATGEAVTTVAMTDDGLGGDLVPEDGVYSSVLPARPDNTIVRYRVRADRGEGVEVVTPRPSDPFEWHAYFVSPVITRPAGAQARIYQVFISPANWTAMWNNITGGRVSGCNENLNWDAKVPAVFVYEGKVTDVLARYQGSRYNRTNGPNISSWTFPGPSAPSPLRALSWRLSFPRYSQQDGAGVVTLNKNTQGCPGYDAGVGYQLYAAADVPAPGTRYVRFHVNGGYYHYMIQYERPDEDMMRAYHAEQAVKYPELPREEVGHLFKSAGCNCDEGPFGWGDQRLLTSQCGHSATVRYEHTYDRKTWSWDSHAEFIDLINDLHAARSSLPNTAALRAYFADRFDIEILLDYMAIMNWSVPFDDMFQNHFLYQRRSDGKWILIPWDLDLNFGGWKGANSSLYVGEQNDPDNRSGWWNYLKDAFLKAYRNEFDARLLELTNTLLHPTNVHALVDGVLAQANPTEAAQAPAGVACSFSGDASAFKSFATARHAEVNNRLSAVIANAGPDQSVIAGSTVQFDARASRPDPGPGAAYTWSNGMTGDFPTFVYSTPGVYTVTLTITVSGTPYRDSVTITVVAAPAEAFQESGGRVVLEAENFYLNDRHGAATAWWDGATAIAGYSGASYMEAMDTTYTKYSTAFGSTSPELRYAILFQNTGSYRVWVRALSGHSDYDSCHVGLDGSERDESYAQRFSVDADTYLWSVDTRGQGVQVVDVATPGVHFFSIWIRESGQIVDKVILTTDAAFTPAGAGPAESGLVPITGSFIRGDANDDGTVDLSDGIAVLLHLFAGGSALECEDHGDADDNGSLNVTDALVILNYLFRGGTAPRAPFPGAGTDPTADPYECGG